MSFYELIIYDQALSVPTQQSITRNMIAMRLSTTPSLKKWPVASFSVRKLNSTYYNGPVMRLRRYDGYTADLYCNQLGQETAVYDISSSTNYTSTSDMVGWTGGFPVYLMRWFDQTGSGRDFI